jgi:hypothetical protein
MNFAGVHGEGEALEDRLVSNASGKVFNNEK